MQSICAESFRASIARRIGPSSSVRKAAMLVLSFIALAIGCIFLALNLNLYEFKIMPDVRPP